MPPNIAERAASKRVCAAYPARLSSRSAIFGRGFDPQAAMNGRGLGLISMRERVNLVKGTISISSNSMAGTEINVRVPSPRTKTRVTGTTPRVRKRGISRVREYCWLMTNRKF